MMDFSLVERKGYKVQNDILYEMCYTDITFKIDCHILKTQIRIYGIEKKQWSNLCFNLKQNASGVFSTNGHLGSRSLHHGIHFKFENQLVTVFVPGDSDCQIQIPIDVFLPVCLTIAEKGWNF